MTKNRKLKALIYLFTWWFLLYAPTSLKGFGVVVGPFRDEAECVKVKDFVHKSKEYRYVSWCWWDGK